MFEPKDILSLLIDIRKRQSQHIGNHEHKNNVDKITEPASW